MPAKPKSTASRTAAPKRSPTTRSRARAKRSRETPRHGQIAERAYFIHLEEGSSDELANWLRAERELMAA